MKPQNPGTGAARSATERQKFRAVKGVRDILPPESALWNRLEQTARDVFQTYNFGEIRLPMIEDAALFARSVGTYTEIVSKETFTFPDVAAEFEELRFPTGEIGYRVSSRKDLKEAFTFVMLRPEATASVCRAYIEHGMHTLPGNVKLYYIGPMFRRERPQKGRFRQFYQIGAEVLGQSDAPGIDAEVIEMLMEFFERCGLTGTTLYINSIGCQECRPAYVAKLRQELTKVKDKLGPDSQRRIETNPLRVLDSKLPEEQAIIEKLPRIADSLCADCRNHFARVQEELKQRGIAYEENWRLVRGLDYYMRTTFEITAPGLGAQNAICGGGRYDGLVELLGGPPTKGIGFAIGTDRVILALQEAGKGPAAGGMDVFVAWMGANAYPVALRLARLLRAEKLSVEVPAEDMKLKKSIGLADKLGARYALIIGEDEVASGSFTLKRLADGDQKKLAESDLVDFLKAARL